MSLADAPTSLPQDDGGDKPQHDLADFETHLALLLPLEEALLALNRYRGWYEAQLHPAERKGLRATIRSLALTIQTIMDRS